MCVCEHEGIKEESECTYFLLPVLTYASAFAFLAPVHMLPVRTGLSVFGFLIPKYSHSILVVCVGSIFFMKPCTVYPGRNFERKGGYDEWLSFERSSSRYNKAHPRVNIIYSILYLPLGPPYYTAGTVEISVELCKTVKGLTLY